MRDPLSLFFDSTYGTCGLRPTRSTSTSGDGCCSSCYTKIPLAKRALDSRIIVRVRGVFGIEIENRFESAAAAALQGCECQRDTDTLRVQRVFSSFRALDR